MHSQVLPGLVLPLALALIFLFRGDARAEVWSHKALLAFGSLASLAISLAMAFGLGVGMTPSGSFNALHLFPVAGLMYYLAGLIQANRGKIYAANPFAAFSITFFSMLIADILGAEILGIGAQWVGGAGWLDGLLLAPSIMFAVTWLAGYLLNLRARFAQ